MYAVIATGGKQYRVKPGQEVTVERLEAEIGDSIEVPAVLVVDDSGSVSAGPDLGERAVTATVTGHPKGEKIRVFNYKNKTRQHKRRGHRQLHTTIRIEEI